MNIFELHKYQKRLKCFGLALGFVVLANGGIKRNLNNMVSDDTTVYVTTLDEPVESNNSKKYELETEKRTSPNLADKETTLPDRKKLNIINDLIIEEQESQINNEVVEDEVQEELSYDEKMNIICERESLTFKELDTVLAGCVAEACDNGYNYDEAYNTASTIYNRAHDISYVFDVNNICGRNTGYSIYYQFICPGQFSVYSNGSYYSYLGRMDLPGYQAAIDMFYSKTPSHDYLNFNNVPPAGEYERFIANGNFYSRHQNADSIILDEDVNERVLSK